jgi:hypothetical protein
VNLDQIHEVLSAGRAEEWHYFEALGTFDVLSLAELGDGTQRFEMEGHHNVATYRANPSLTLAWGQRENEKFQEAWANSFADPSASSFLLDVLWNGAVIDRHTLVYVDGNRVAMPLPQLGEGLSVPRLGYGIAKIVRGPGANGWDLDDYMSRAGMSVSD